jgi:hypothetical protein
MNDRNKPLLLFAEDLDLGRCNCGQCKGEKTLQAACHPDSLLAAVYETGALTFYCGQCRALVARIAVGRRMLAPEGRNAN